MKFLLLIPVLGFVMLTSCRTVPPIDPMTMEPSTRCLPGSAEVTQSSK